MDRQAVREAMISGNLKFFFGSDRAPHLLSAKAKYPPAAGIFTTGNVLLSTLCKLFEKHGALDKLAKFVAGFGADYYGLTRNEGQIVLQKKRWIPCGVIGQEIGGVGIFGGGEELDWQVARAT